MMRPRRRQTAHTEILLGDVSVLSGRSHHIGSVIVLRCVDTSPSPSVTVSVTV